MLYAILAYHVEAEVLSWTPEADAALMTELHRVHGRLEQAGQLGPAARLGETREARTLRGPGPGMVIDLQGLAEELEDLKGKGISPNIRVSDRATICFPFHRLEDGWEEERLGDQALAHLLEPVFMALQ